MMMQQALLPVFVTWAASFAFYGLAGTLIKLKKISRTPHILLTVAGFMADFLAMFFQWQALLMLKSANPEFTLDPQAKGLQTVFTNLSMGLYCLTALFGFSRIVGWGKLGRLHVPTALIFICTLIAARVLYIQLIG